VLPSVGDKPPNFDFSGSCTLSEYFPSSFVYVIVCTVTDFSADDKANAVKFCTAVHRRPRQGIANFCELRSLSSPKLDDSASARATPTGM